MAARKKIADSSFQIAGKKDSRFTNKKAATYIEKTLKSAIANAEHNFGMDPDKLYVSKILIDKGPVLKRVNPRAMGRADIIRKPTAHITVEVSERN